MTELLAVAQPEVIQSLPPVTIRHVMEGPDPWFAFWATLAVASAGLVVSLIILKKVFDQITIANKQIGIASEQLERAEEELAAVRADFELATKMYERSIREPILELHFQLGSEVFQRAPMGQYREVYLEVVVSNKGTRAAKNVVIEVLIPFGEFFGQPAVGSEALRATKFVGVGVFRSWQIPEPNLRIAASNHYRRSLTLNLKPEKTTLGLLWRVFDDDFAWPPMDWGVAEVVFNLSSLRND